MLVIIVVHALIALLSNILYTFRKSIAKDFLEKVQE